MDDLHARRALSFGSVATTYAQHRPSYPDQAVEWALESLLNNAPRDRPGDDLQDSPKEGPEDGLTSGLKGGPQEGRVLDLAAGTGKLTEAMLRCGVSATAALAVEPDEEMRAEFSRRLPEIAVLPGSAEQIPVDGSSVDAVLVGQAFHWFDPDRALPEIARVLRPGGVLAVLGNAEDDSVGWVAQLNAAAQAGRSVGNIGRGFADVPEHPAFGGPEQRRFTWRWLHTIDSLLETTSTHSWALTSLPDQRTAALAAIRRFLEQHPATRDGTFELPMRTLVLRTIREPGRPKVYKHP